jgi:hypothetical protein
VTEPERAGLRPGHWLLGGIVALLVIVVVVVVVRRDDGDRPPGPSAGATGGPSSAAGPVCAPTVSQIGYTERNGAIAFGLVAASACPQAAVNTIIEVTAVGKDGKDLTTDQASASVTLPVLLPGRRVGLGGTLIVEDPVARLKTRVSQTANVAAAEFSSWPAKVEVTDITHAAADSSGRTRVSGTVVSDPASATLCHPRFYLVLRDRTGKIVFGASTVESEPVFDERVPAGVDWSRAEISVVLGVTTLGDPSGSRLSCRTP